MSDSQVLPTHWVSADPGETTGYNTWEGNRQVHQGQAELWDFVHAMGATAGLCPAELCRDPELIERLAGWEQLVMEDWHLYPWLALDLSFDKQDTVRGIGALQFIADASGRTYTLQPAQIKDAAEAAGAQELFVRPLHENRHANDATRHGVHFVASKGLGVVQAA